METLFIPAKYKGKISLGKELIEKLPSKIGLAASIQFVDRLSDVKKEIESIKNKKAIIGGQILGCDVKNAENIKGKVDVFLYIGDGAFHPLAIALKTNKQVLQYNPLNKEFKKITEEEINQCKKSKKLR